AQEPDLILSDMMMPGMGGTELLREIRAHSKLAAVPYVLLTAKADDDTRVRMLREGASDYVTKPFLGEELRARARNLIEAKRAQDGLREFSAKLERSNRDLQAFAAAASHDLQEPLRKVEAFGELLEDECGPALGQDGRQYIYHMRSAARRMQRLIEDLLSLSRLDTRAEPFSQVDLAAIAREVVSDLQARIRQLDARVELGGSRDACVLQVEDNGIGFDEKFLDRIFVMFQRLHSRSEYDGTGIGLAICRKIAERHGGAITARSQPGQGATFLVTLPVKHSNFRGPIDEERRPTPGHPDGG
ncbi:MAG: response regulator, partial [Candidatus Wallbacteria bacterium]|nr:response regulator [Candidatus Wallbacteria bacterium]